MEWESTAVIMEWYYHLSKAPSHNIFVSSFLRNKVNTHTLLVK
ncbi:hypothetical protein FM106_02100 [Brachybacterium faecium]|nr:hypothetical protein FM106_02100 [Brachybacterium faecium]